MAKDNAMELRKLLLEKKSSLLESERPIYKTSCMFRPNQYNQQGEFDVRLASKSRLLSGYKTLLRHDEAAKDLGVNNKHIGFTVEEWTHDFKLRVAVLDRAETLTTIARLEDNLRTVLTPKQLREIGIADLAAEIEGLK